MIFVGFEKFLPAASKLISLRIFLLTVFGSCLLLWFRKNLWKLFYLQVWSINNKIWHNWKYQHAARLSLIGAWYELLKTILSLPACLIFIDPELFLLAYFGSGNVFNSRRFYSVQKCDQILENYYLNACFLDRCW